MPRLPRAGSVPAGNRPVRPDVDTGGREPEWPIWPPAAVSSCAPLIPEVQFDGRFLAGAAAI